MLEHAIPQPSNPAWFTESLLACPVMAVFRGLSPERTVELATVAWDVGVLNVEVPIESARAVASLEAAVAAGASRGMRVGAGTIISASQLSTAISAGAAYGVSPGLDPTLLTLAGERSFPFIPGVATASEVLHAQRLGFRWIKAFPASVLGTEWFTAMKGPFPETNFIATGGMTGRNAGLFLASGASVVGVGSALGTADEREMLSALIAPH